MVITSTATHAFFPLMDRNWAALRAQVHTAAKLYEKHFGRRSAGMWRRVADTCRGSTSCCARWPFATSSWTATPSCIGSPAGLRRVRTHLLRHRRGRFRRDTESSRTGVEPKHGYPVTRTTAISTATSA